MDVNVAPWEAPRTAAVENGCGSLGDGFEWHGIKGGLAGERWLKPNAFKDSDRSLDTKAWLHPDSPRIYGLDGFTDLKIRA